MLPDFKRSQIVQKRGVVGAFCKNGMIFRSSHGILHKDGSLVVVYLLVAVVSGV